MAYKQSFGPGNETDPKEKKRPTSIEVKSTAEDLGRGAKRITLDTTKSYESKGKQMGADYKPSEEVRRAANLLRKKESEKNKSVVTTKGVKSVSSIENTLATKKPATIEKKESLGYYHKGSNIPNMPFGGRSTSGFSKDQPIGDKSYTVSPSKPISGKPNTFSSRELTEREAKVKKSRFSSATANPFDSTEAGWEKYLSGVEARESKMQSKVSSRKALESQAKKDLSAKKQSLSKKISEKKKKIEAFKSSRLNKN